ncbi:hypothetical protein GCM10023149_14070 [Mucilaginibacter gynuensis]|uniref:Uncharacterized protein n=1 Tax=Mucilaginibacter gynuensis TaxID=1302236 RepID=A0ABP8G3P1_9SPHI
MATITIKYTELLSLSVKQPFYNNKVCRGYQATPILDFNIVPTPETLAFMKAKKMVFKNIDNSGGFTVLVQTKGKTPGGNELLGYPITVADKLTFVMLLKKPDLINFNVLPTSKEANKIYYFGNQVADKTALRDDLHLSKNITGVDGAADQLKKVSKNYNFHFAGVTTTAAVKVKHLLTGAKVNAKLVTSQNGKSEIYVDLSALPLGCCQLLISNVVSDEFYYLGNMADQPMFGVIELSLSKLLSANYRVVEPDLSLTVKRPKYTVLFKNRQTTWRYNIQLQPTSPLYIEMAKLTAVQKADFIKQLTVATNDTAIKFKLASNTDSNFVFISTKNIALQERYALSTNVAKDLIISLSKYVKTPKETIIKSSLPYPSTGSIDAGSLPTIYSDVFITL